MTPNRLARIRALGLLAKLAEMDIDVQGEIVESVLANGVRVTVILSRDMPTPRIEPMPIPMPTATPPRLTPLMRDVVALLSHEKPAKCEWLANKVGKKATGYFRCLCTDLVRLGVARHVKGVGYFAV